METKRRVIFHHLSLLLLFLLLACLPLRCSALPILQDLLHRKSSATPLESKERLPRPSLLERQSISIEQRRKALMRLARIESSVAPEQGNLVEETEAQRNTGLPSAIGNERKQSTIQPWERLPIKPEQAREESEEEKSRAEDNEPELRPRAKSTPRKGFPLTGGTSLLNIGRLNLKADWCNANPFMDRVHHHGCKAKFVENNMCYGQCNSFFIPKKFVSCSYCTPSEQETVSVRLECPGQSPDFVMKKVIVVKRCSCQACGRRRPIL